MGDTHETAPHVTGMLLVADTARALDRGQRLAESCGVRIRRTAGIAEAADLPDALFRTDICLVEVDAAPDGAFDRLLDRIEREAHAGSIAGVVAIAPDLIDRAMARLGSSAVTLLCGASELERSAALRLALAVPPNRLGQAGGDDAATRLRAMSEELDRLARAIADIAEQGTARQPVALTVASAADARDVAAADFRGLIRTRRLRDQYLPGSLFADPAWDMLLDLSAARLERQPVAVSSLCIAAAVPPTTALRWIRLMVQEGVLLRTADPLDGRRVFISLSDEAATAMIAYVAALKRAGPTFA